MDGSAVKRLLLRALVPALLAFLLTAAPASAGLFFPDAGGGSQQAENTRTLYIIIFIIALPIWIGVEGLIFYCMWKYRARKGAVAAQIHGNTRLEIGWTVGAAVILVFITTATFIMLPGILNPAESTIDENGNQVGSAAAFAVTDQEPPPKGAYMNIDVDGMQYVWRFQYPSIDGKKVYSFTNMYVPVGMTITLDIRSNDVQHSWWIPALGGKADALPGYTNKTWFQVKRPGEWRGQCAELCGRNHANMYAKVIGLPFDQWRAWYDRQAAAIATAEKAAAAGRKKYGGSTGGGSE